ncbi:MAG: DegT/DnrJ/EryC1/StrS family aminotransferase [Planctomycetota bacterium]|nr:DegT/DnrJ/EryC1/StrS family aminotransferase [Planctomycetota bacterium]
MEQIPIARPVTGEEEWKALRDVLESGWLAQGPRVAAFERLFAERHGVRHAVAVHSCTAGLHLALVALGIGEGDEVIVPAFTWIATANAVVYCGATPVFADIDRQTYNIDPAGLADLRTPRTRAVIPVHLFGLCADVDAVAEALPGVPIVEDAACAAGATSRGRPAGGLGEIAAFSFHPRKSISTGEGGMITTDRDDLAELVASLRNHGAETPEEQRLAGPRPWLLPEFNHLGFNYRMTDLQAAVGLVQFGKLDAFLEQRREWAAFYQRELAEIPWLRTPASPADGEHAWQSFVCHVDENRAPCSRNEIMQRLHALGISTRPGTHAVHALGFYRDRFGARESDCPVALECAARTLAIPLHNAMGPPEYDRVVEALRSIG